MNKYLLATTVGLIIISFQNCGEFNSNQSIISSMESPNSGSELEIPTDNILTSDSAVGAGAESVPKLDSEAMAAVAANDTQVNANPANELYAKGKYPYFWKCQYTLTGQDSYVWKVERLTKIDDNCNSSTATVKLNNPKAKVSAPVKSFVGYHDPGLEVATRIKCAFVLQGKDGGRWNSERISDFDDNCETQKNFILYNNPEVQILSLQKIIMTFDSIGQIPVHYWRCDYRIKNNNGSTKYLHAHSKVKDVDCKATTKSLQSQEKNSTVTYLDKIFIGYDKDVVPVKIPTCSPAKINEITSGGGGEVIIQCNLKLTKAYNITKKLVILGNEASGITVDLGGSTIGEPGKPRTLLVRSQENNVGSKVTWSVPSDVTIKNGIIYGYVGITYRDNFWSDYNMTEMYKLSRRSDYVAVLQKRSPSNITFTNMTLHGNHDGVVFYAYTGTTDIKLLNSKFLGNAALAIYLEAESKGHVIKNNLFDIITKRELIAIDGAAYTTISGNKFSRIDKGGIYIYRNCGENGVARHQKPTHNIITENHFAKTTKVGVFLGSRQGGSKFCPDDNDAKYGSGVSDLDFAQYNTVTYNKFINHDPIIKNNDKHNNIAGNVRLNQ